MVIAALAHAVPAAMDQDGLWSEYFSSRFADDPRAERLWRAAGVRRRHGVVDPRGLDVSDWSTGARMRRYATEAVPLGKEALGAALSGSGLAPADIGLFAVASCTGYATPGLDAVLARDLGMSDAVQRVALGHMGCHAALPGLGVAADFVRARARPAVLLCCELTSLHLQPIAAGKAGLRQLAAHALFADAAAALVLTPERPGPEVVEVASRTDASTADLMTWEVTDKGFVMGLSPRVPDVLGRQVRPAVEDLLGRHGLRIGDVAGWAVHPGGPRVLDVVADRLGLADADLALSRGILRDYGNCSSATVLLVLERLLATDPGGPVVALAFGPGLTLYVALLSTS